MELGRQPTPSSLLEDADLDETVKWAVWAKMNNTGQCWRRGQAYSSSSRNWPDRFLRKVPGSGCAALKARRTQWTRRTTLGPLVHGSGLGANLLGQVPNKPSQGRPRLVMGWQTHRSAGIFHAKPTILTNIKPAQSRL